MRKIFVSLALVLLLSGCDQSFKCIKGDDELKYVYNDDELVSVTRNGEDVGAIEFSIQNASFESFGSDKFEEKMTAFNILLGYECK